MLFLVGMPASGKSTLARQLAQKWNWGSLDLDEEIEKKYLRTIPEIFAEEGESQFRKIEADVLRQIPIESQKILATGGGTPCFHQNMEYMLSVGKVIFLDVPLNTILERILNQPTQRPLFAGKSKEEVKIFLEKLYAERLPFYQKAHLRISHADELLLNSKIF
ncbi:MAG: shikimate kinase [Raineya sp.]|nr:shikimate kinase [Raineya sp.]MDW8296075.1 shikimate kinase [Raineya sp.]